MALPSINSDSLARKVNPKLFKKFTTTVVSFLLLTSLAFAQSAPTHGGPIWVDTSIKAGTTLEAGTGITSTTGAISATAGNVNAGVALTVAAAVPAASSCGTSPAVTAGSSNNAGQFTLGTGTPTACTITFATAYATKAFCTVTPASSGGAAISGGYYLSAQSKSAFTLTIGTGTDSLVWNYTCVGN